MAKKEKSPFQIAVKASYEKLKKILKNPTPPQLATLEDNAGVVKNPTPLRLATLEFVEPSIKHGVKQEEEHGI